MTVNSDKKIKEPEFGFYEILLLIILMFSVLNQGGYFPGCIMLVGLIEVLICFYRNIRLKPSCILTGVFCIWYFVCSIRTGIVIEYAARGLIPFVVFLYYIIVSESVYDKKKLITYAVRLMLIVAMFSVIICIIGTIKSGSLQRASFPFQYSNATGIYFGTMFLFSDKSGDRILKRFKYLFLSALLLTQSVGAIVITMGIVFLSDIKNKRNIIILVGLIIISIALNERVHESMYTFLERLLQSHDGIRCILKNPWFGIGAGYWKVLKPYYQTGFYSAGMIHGSIIQIGVNSGFIGLVIFLIILILKLREIRKDNTCFLIAVAIILHSFFDFSLSFLGIGMFLALILREMNYEQKVNTALKAVLLLCLGIVFFVGSYGLYTARSLRNTINNNYMRVIEKYENSFIAKYSESATIDYLKALYALNEHDKVIKVIDGLEYKTSNITIVKSWCDNVEVIIQALKEQPYNKAFYEEIRSSDNTDAKNQAEEILQQSLKKMSFLGKILYEYKGEN